MMWTTILRASLLLHGVLGMYADQAGELDWKREQVGAIQIAVYQQRRVYVVADASGTGVLAALNVRSGAVEWRRLLPENGEALALTPYAAVTLSGRYLRAWRLGDGALLWDAAVYAPDTESKASDLIAMIQAGTGAARSKKCLLLALAGNIIEARDCTSGESKNGWPFLADPEEDAKLGAICSSQTIHLKQLQAMPDNTVLVLGSCGSRSLVISLDPFLSSDSSVSPILAVTSGQSLSSVLVAKARGMPILVTYQNNKVQAYDVVAALRTSNTNIDKYRIKAPVPVTAFFQNATNEEHDLLSLRIEPNSAGRLLRLTTPDKASRFVVAAPVDHEQALLPLGSSSCLPPHCTLGAFATPSSAASGSGEPEARVFWSEYQNAKFSLIDAETHSVLAANQSVPQLETTTTENSMLKLFPHVFEKKATEELGYRLLCLSKAESAIMVSMQNGDLAWIRDEALAAITALDFASSPSRTKVIEDESSEHWHRRLHLTLSQRLELQAKALFSMASRLNNTLASFADTEASRAEAKGINAIRYGFDKLAIAGTRSGRIAALAMHTGETLWSSMAPGPVTAVLTVRDGGTSVPEIAVLSQSTETSEWLLSVLNGHDGTPLREAMHLGHEQIQLVARTGAHANGEDVLLIARETNGSHVDLRISPPGTGEAVLARRLSKGGKPLYLSLKVKDEETGAHMLKVHQVTVNAQQKIIPELRGELILAHRGESLLSIAYARPDRETVSSKAHIMGDDALLLKYLNPHLAAVCTSTPGGSPAPLLDSKLRPPSEDSIPSEPPTLFLTLIDIVAARVVTRLALPYGAGPCALSVSENWVVAAYWNAKAKRQELASVSLHEGVIDRHGLSPFKVPEQESTFIARAAPPPVALHRSFALDKPVLSLVPTVTTRGIASKHFLLAVAPGQIAALDRRAIDPRRPAIDLSESSSKSISRAMRKKFERELDEGLQPYSPFLILKPRTFLTYTHQLMGLTDLYTAPAKLESTTLVFAAGIDLYGARYTPSGAFDLLADDFNYLLLLLLLSALALASFLLRIAAKRKQLRLLWA